MPNRVTFLSPFDRLVHDRDRAEALFGFHYRLEMYVPRAKRQYGYYVLPILGGDRILGRIDVERDKPSNTLRVNGVWWEDGVRPVPLEAGAETAGVVRLRSVVSRSMFGVRPASGHARRGRDEEMQMNASRRRRFSTRTGATPGASTRSRPGGSPRACRAPCCDPMQQPRSSPTA